MATEPTTDQPADEPAAATGSMTALGTIAQWVDSVLPAEPTADARDAIDELIPTGDGQREYVFRFSALICLSAWIASFGLLADSGAVVIGAMLVAPLMTARHLALVAHALITETGRLDGIAGLDDLLVEVDEVRREVVDQAAIAAAARADELETGSGTDTDTSNTDSTNTDSTKTDSANTASTKTDSTNTDTTNTDSTDTTEEEAP